jgi:hypothetical protein
MGQHMVSCHLLEAVLTEFVWGLPTAFKLQKQ